MATDTDRLIEQLAAQAAPVRRLASPFRRTLGWLALAAAILVLVTTGFGLRSDLLEALAEPGAAVEWSASVLTGVLAAYAAFQVSVPGRSAAWAWLPVPALALWLGGVGFGCLREFLAVGGGALAFEADGSECALMIALVSVPLGLAMLLMVRHAGAVRPMPTALLAALSAAALAAAGVGMIHEGEAMLMVLLWHVGAVLALSLASWVFGRKLFGWIGYAR